MNVSSSELQRTAWHEAGHALVGFLQFGNPGKVTIVPDGKCLGCQTTERFYASGPGYVRALPSAMREPHIRALVRHSLAGRAAESVLLGRLRLRFVQDEDGLDARRHVHYLGRVPEWAEWWLLDREWKRVRRWLQEHRRQLDRFARVLLTRRTLSGEEVYDLLLRRAMQLRRPRYLNT